VKQNLIIIFILMSLLGCSAKYSARKNGAILGTTAGVLAGSVMGLAVTGAKSRGRNQLIPNMLLGALAIGTIGYLSGSAMGYVADGVKGKKEVKELSSTQAMVSKHIKNKKPVLSSPDSINEAILNGTLPSNDIANSVSRNDVYVNKIENTNLEEKEEFINKEAIREVIPKDNTDTMSPQNDVYINKVENIQLEEKDEVLPRKVINDVKPIEDEMY